MEIRQRNKWIQLVGLVLINLVLLSSCTIRKSVQTFLEIPVTKTTNPQKIQVSENCGHVTFEESSFNQQPQPIISSNCWNSWRLFIQQAHNSYFVQLSQRKFDSFPSYYILFKSLKLPHYSA